MKNEQLYLRRNEKGYQFVVQEFDETRIPVKEEFMFKEAAVVVLYPDGLIDVLPIIKDADWHLEYYKMLVEKSPRFAGISKKFPIGWRGEYNTIKANMIMADMGIVLIQNIDIPNLPEEYSSREDYYSTFLFYGASKLTKESEENLNMIFDNYPNNRCIYEKLNKKTKEFDEEEVVKKR